MKNAIRNTALTLALLGAAWSPGATLFIETESFNDLGGWVVDPQMIEVFGSPYILAHGMGVPVADAKTTVAIPSPGNWSVWVRTRDWTKTWNRGTPAGRFELLIGGASAGIFGTQKETWHWQKAPRPVKLPKGDITLALKDLTGFDGRCDSILLSNDPGFTPPEDPAGLARLRQTVMQKTRAAESYDCVVIGGGIGGLCAALSSARSGLKTALVHNRPVLGGNNSSEVRVHLGGKLYKDPYPKLGEIVAEIGPRRGDNAADAARYEDDLKMKVASGQENLTLYMNHHVTGVTMKGKTITAVQALKLDSSETITIPGTYFIDSTGDGFVAVAAGAKFMYGRESKAQYNEPSAPDKPDRQVLGSSVQWNTVDAKKPTSFPDIDWGHTVTDKNAEAVSMGEWTWETGMKRDQMLEAEYIRDYGMMVVYTNWSYLKNHAPEATRAKFANRSLAWVAFIAGKRESRRIYGDLVLTENDLKKPVLYPDATACTTWSIDLHYPDPENAKKFEEPFKSIAKHMHIKPYPVPYRCLYARDVDNLFIAGRSISVTHIAHGTIRVMRTIGMFGEVTGMAAAIAKKHSATPRGVYENHLPELIEAMKKGIGAGLPKTSQQYN